MSTEYCYAIWMISVAGENSDLIVRGEKIHVQTEDWGRNGNVIVTRIFKNGSVIKTFKLAYEKIKNPEDENNRRAAVVKLHQYVIEKLQTN